MSSASVLGKSIGGLTNLPPETLDLICGHLCLHCSHPHAVGASLASVDDAYSNQKTLSSMSRSCRRLRARAQPVLFHLYHTELPHIIAGDRRTFRAQLFSARHHFREKRLIALFLRTLLERLDLAASVRALALYQAPWTGLVQIMHSGNAEVTNLRQLQHELIAQVTARGRQMVRDNDTTGESYLATDDDAGDISLELLQELTLAQCASSLEQLCIERTMRLDEFASADRDWRAWSYDLPQLTYLAFPGLRAGADETYYYQEARNLVARAPKLRVLVAPDCEADSNHWMERQYSSMRWDLSLKYLTKLSLSGIERTHLRAILAGCPVLADLEYFCKDTGFDDDVLSPDEDLSVACSTLRRVCYSIATEDMGSSHNGELEILDEGYYPSWAALPALETLEVDRMLIYGPVEEGDDSESEPEVLSGEQPVWTTDEESIQQNHQPGGEQSHDPGSNTQRSRKMSKTTPEDFMARLPLSLRSLRIGHITCWPAMYRDAIALAHQASARFSCLRQLRLEVYEIIPANDEVAVLTSVFDSAGIACSVVPVKRQGRDARGLLPPRLAQSGPIVTLDDTVLRAGAAGNLTF